MKTRAQEVYEGVEALVASGLTKAEAFRALAEERGQSAKSLQGAYYQHTKKVSGTQKARRRETTPDDALESARAVFEQAIESIDAEVERPRTSPTRPGPSTRRSYRSARKKQPEP